nr:Maf family protein [Paenibacillus montaniterrae]
MENEIMPAFVQATSESIAKPGNSAAAGESIARFNSRAAAKRIAFGAYGQYELVFQSDQLAAVVGHTYSQVTFRSMSDDEIYAYIKTGEPLDKAGSYGIQGIGSIFVEKIEGDFYSVMGLPLNLLYPTLLQFGISPFAT